LGVPRQLSISLPGKSWILQTKEFGYSAVPSTLTPAASNKPQLLPEKLSMQRTNGSLFSGPYSMTRVIPDSAQAPSITLALLDDAVFEDVASEPIATIAKRANSTARNGTDFIYGSKSK
jgi:hypothetical protein